MNERIKIVFPEETIRLVLLSGASPDAKLQVIREEIAKANDDCEVVDVDGESFYEPFIPR